MLRPNGAVWQSATTFVRLAMGYAAEVIAWLDELESHLPETPSTLAQVSETIWSLRQSLTAGVTQMIVEKGP